MRTGAGKCGCSRAEVATIYSTTTGTGGIQTLPVTGTGRYIRMYGTTRATQYGYSLYAPLEQMDAI